MNKDDLKAAIVKGQFLKAQLAKAKELEDKEKMKGAKKAALLEKSKLEKDVQYYLKRVADYLTDAISKSETSFTLLSYNIENSQYFKKVIELIKPELKKLELNFDEKTSSHYVTLGYDPDHGYEQTLYKLIVYVPVISE